MKIGLTYTGSEIKDANYVRWLKDGDETIEVVRLSVLEDPDAIKGCDALVLSGGVDIEPTIYGGAAEYPRAPKEWQKDRDLFEHAVLVYAWQHGLPVVGVCRGLQLINVSCKGTLVQDLGEQEDGAHDNRDGVDKRHGVKILEGTLLEAIAGLQQGQANSAHHQAIDRLGDDLRVNCLAEDGTIEGIEWADPAEKPFMMAVQWHPERMYTNGFTDTGLYRSIRDRLVGEVRKTKLK
jgi:putative glutamine amidotransferase